MIDPNALLKFYKACRSVSSTAKRFAVHRSTVHRWIVRARSDGRGYLRHTGLSRRYAHGSPGRSKVLSASERSSIVALRERYGWCAERIVLFLKRHGQLRNEIGSSTAYRFLKAKGMIRLQGHHRRPRFQDTVHMHLKNAKSLGKLQMDVKYVTPELSGLVHTVYEYAVIDILSRYKAAVLLPELGMDHAILALQACLRVLPFSSDFVQTDNGLEFQSRFTLFCHRTGLAHHHVHKSNPNENAVIERSFRTDEEEFYHRLSHAPKDLTEPNAWYQAYLHHYNTERIHLGLKHLTPVATVANLFD